MVRNQTCRNGDEPPVLIGVIVLMLASGFIAVGAGIEGLGWLLGKVVHRQRRAQAGA